MAKDPIAALVHKTETAGVLAIITGVEGPSYRPEGAAMGIFADGERAGTLSSGCVEGDIALHAMEALDAGKPKSIRYGRGSPFMDIQLPCGGGLDILLVPNPDTNVLRDVQQRQTDRVPCTMAIERDTGALSLHDTGETGWAAETFFVRYNPPVQFLVFGKGPEAGTFAALIQSAGYPNRLYSPDPETLDIAAASGCPTERMDRRFYPDSAIADPWTAVVLFFHDHDWEPQLLAGALETEAFYIGAQGSQRARDARNYVLEAMGVTADQMARLHGPVGLIPSARDAGTLAVSVLAEVLAKAMVPNQKA
ncbi:MAG: XdhC family protein [Pseudomonadota bacterium]